jgi:5-methylcytosine-specific restriction endonuclease McrA
MNPGKKMTYVTQKKLVEEYANMLERPEWLIRRYLIIQKDGKRCQNCGSTSNLQVHHRQYHRWIQSGSYKKPWEYKDKYLITLCFNCHQAGHKCFSIPVFNV